MKSDVTGLRMRRRYRTYIMDTERRTKKRTKLNKNPESHMIKKQKSGRKKVDRIYRASRVENITSM